MQKSALKRRQCRYAWQELKYIRRSADTAVWFGVCLLGCNGLMQIDISATAGVFEIFHTFKICVLFSKCATNSHN